MNTDRTLGVGMCGIAGFVAITPAPVPCASEHLRVMADVLRHRGPDGEGFWLSEDETVGLAHTRLAIIDTSSAAQQPMIGQDESVLIFNGEIYNYKELRQKFATKGRAFYSASDTECILAAYEAHSMDFLQHLRGMFAIALWDPNKKTMILARDRFGIKPLHYLVKEQVIYFASEAKALLPFLDSVQTNDAALAEYLSLQTTLGRQTLFEHIEMVMPGEVITIDALGVKKTKYWDISYDIDDEHSEQFFVNKLQDLLEESVALHLRSDVPVGSYLSGGVDSSLIALLASKEAGHSIEAFHGRYVDPPEYDESTFARAVADLGGLELHTQELTETDFEEVLRNVTYHMDYPVAGPGAIPQFLTSGLAAQHVKVVLGGQGGDEIFGGYARYLIGYLEQCMRAAIDGTSGNGHFVVTMESIIPNLGLLREYQPLLQRFWSQGLFGPMDERYLRLIDRSTDLGRVIKWQHFDRDALYSRYLSIFNNENNVRKEAYFDSMTHFDFKTLLPALLHVEDRMSMAHGLESRVPFLDHPLVEFVATIPADIKFKDGQLKRLLKVAFADVLPPVVRDRRDKMGFPVPLAEWAQGPLRGSISGIIESLRDRDLVYLDREGLTGLLDTQQQFSRGLWALLSLEMWFREFHDQSRSIA